MSERILVKSEGEDRFAIVDPEDFVGLSRYSWKLDRHGYAIRNTRVNGKSVGVLMHRQILGLTPRDRDVHTDHRNGERLDNRRDNLRRCSLSENNRHNGPHRSSSSRYKGVTWHRGVSKWQAAIYSGGKTHYLGLYESEDAAARAYDVAAEQLFGDYAFLNFGARS